MARVALRIAENVSGDFFVDSTCIDCDACRQIAPTVFHDIGDQSVVFHQPQTADELMAAQRALISCPTASIGDIAKRDMRAAVASLPELTAEDVYRCGYTSESSFGAISYYVQDAKTMVDSPRFANPLVRNIEAMGGVRRMLLTHQDDVADHEKFQPDGLDPVQIDAGMLMIPTPGHTKGHSVFLYRDKFLFTGDHLAWDPDDRKLIAFRNACWYSWSEQIDSMRRLLDYRFEWVLPGHGRPVNLPADEMHELLQQCIAWMKSR